MGSKSDTIPTVLSAASYKIRWLMLLILKKFKGTLMYSLPAGG
jgi:hypothetical protein